MRRPSLGLKAKAAAKAAAKDAEAAAARRVVQVRAARSSDSPAATKRKSAAYERALAQRRERLRAGARAAAEAELSKVAPNVAEAAGAAGVRALTPEEEAARRPSGLERAGELVGLTGPPLKTISHRLADNLIVHSYPTIHPYL